MIGRVRGMMMCAASAAFALACGVDAEQQVVLSSGSELATERSIPSGRRGEEERNQTIPERGMVHAELDPVPLMTSIDEAMDAPVEAAAELRSGSQVITNADSASCGEQIYLKIGTYHTKLDAPPPPGSVIHDRVVRGTTFEAVAPPGFACPQGEPGSA